MEDNKEPKQNSSKSSETKENKSSSTGSDSDMYKRTVIGTGAQKSDENFDGTQQQSAERDIEDRDTNDGDANTENNY